MTDESSAGAHRVATVVVLAALLLLAGCTSGGIAYAQTGDDGPIEVTDVGTPEALFASPAWLDATVEPVENATAIVWIGADGKQIGAEELHYGTNEVNIETSSYPDTAYGQNRLVIVRGGETECFGDRCSHVGGSEMMNTTVEVTPE